MRQETSATDQSTGAAARNERPVLRATTPSVVENVAGAHPEPASPRRGSGLVALAVGYVLAIIISAMAAAAVSAATGGTGGLLARLGGQLAFWTMLVGTVLWVHRGRDGSIAVQLGLRVRWFDVPVGVVAGIATQVVLVPTLYLPLRGLIDDDELSAPARELFGGMGGIQLAVLGLMVVVVAPIVEEVFFRGAVLHALRRCWSVAAAVAVSSVVFGATHFQPLQLPALALAGAVFAVAVVRTGRLGAAIAVHAGFNATTFVTLAVLQ